MWQATSRHESLSSKALTPSLPKTNCFLFKLVQKYRLYLRRISSSHQANMFAALGSADSAHLPLNGFVKNNSLVGSAHNTAVRSLAYPSGMLGRLNSASGLGMLGISSSPGMVQLGHVENLNKTPIDNQTKFHPVLIPGNQNGNILQGMPASFEFNQVQHNKGVGYIGDISNANHIAKVFPFPVASQMAQTVQAQPRAHFFMFPTVP